MKTRLMVCGVFFGTFLFLISSAYATNVTWFQFSDSDVSPGPRSAYTYTPRPMNPASPLLPDQDYSYLWVNGTLWYLDNSNGSRLTRVTESGVLPTPRIGAALCWDGSLPKPRLVLVGGSIPGPYFISSSEINIFEFGSNFTAGTWIYKGYMTRGGLNYGLDSSSCARVHVGEYLDKAVGIVLFGGYNEYFGLNRDIFFVDTTDLDDNVLPLISTGQTVGRYGAALVPVYMWEYNGWNTNWLFFNGFDNGHYVPPYKCTMTSQYYQISTSCSLLTNLGDYPPNGLVYSGVTWFGNSTAVVFGGLNGGTGVISNSLWEVKSDGQNLTWRNISSSGNAPLPRDQAALFCEHEQWMDCRMPDPEMRFKGVIMEGGCESIFYCSYNDEWLGLLH